MICDGKKDESGHFPVSEHQFLLARRWPMGKFQVSVKRNTRYKFACNGKREADPSSRWMDFEGQRTLRAEPLSDVGRSIAGLLVIKPKRVYPQIQAAWTRGPRTPGDSAAR